MAPKAGNQVAYLCLQHVRKPQNPQKDWILGAYSWYLRLITYGVLAGSTEMIQEIGLVGAREMYNSLGVPMPGMVEAMKCMKDASLPLL